MIPCNTDAQLLLLEHMRLCHPFPRLPDVRQGQLHQIGTILTTFTRQRGRPLNDKFGALLPSMLDPTATQCPGVF